MNKSGLLRILLTAWLAWVSLWAVAQPTHYSVVAGHARDLVVLDGQQLVSFHSDRFLQAPFLVVYFGAGWCPDCRRFSPALVDAYNRQPSGARRFEVLLVSRDKTAQGMLNFMTAEKMTWPALAFDKIATADDLERLYSGHGIPCLTVLDSDGKIVLQSKNDQDANEVLEQLQELIKTRPKPR
jgi:nucleoredoxin